MTDSAAHSLAALNAVKAAWRGDWSEFDGRTLPARQLHPRGVHGWSELDRWAAANATLAGLFRRVFIR